MVTRFKGSSNVSSIKMDNIIQALHDQFVTQLEDHSKELEQHNFSSLDQLVQKFESEALKVDAQTYETFLKQMSVKGEDWAAQKIWREFLTQVIEKEKVILMGRLLVKNSVIFYTHLMSFEKGIDENRFFKAHSQALSKTILRLNLFWRTGAGRTQHLDHSRIEETVQSEVEKCYEDLKHFFNERKADAEREMSLFVTESVQNYTKKFQSSTQIKDDLMRHQAAVEAALQLFKANTKVIGLKLGDFRIGRDDHVFEQKLRHEMEDKFRHFNKSQNKRCCIL